MLFDLDGTLTDPEVGIVGSLRHAVASVGHAAADDLDLRWAIGPPLRENFARYGLPEHLHDDAVLAFRTRHREVGLFEAELVPGIVDVLRALRLDGVRLALATAKPVEQAVITLEHVGVADHFAVVAGSRADGALTPKADIVADALAQLGLPGSPSLPMVGDRRHDVEGARANGCTAVSVTWGYAEADELATAAPDHLVATTDDLLAVLRAC